MDTVFQFFDGCVFGRIAQRPVRLSIAILVVSAPYEALRSRMQSLRQPVRTPAKADKCAVRLTRYGLFFQRVLTRIGERCQWCEWCQWCQELAICDWQLRPGGTSPTTHAALNAWHILAPALGTLLAAVCPCIFLIVPHPRCGVVRVKHP